MALRNTPGSYGLLTRSLHWLTALLVLTARPFGAYVARMEVTLDSLKYFGWHKSAGLVILVLIALRIGWHRISPPPELLGEGGWKDRLARRVHRTFYVLLVLMPLSGWFASSATGIDTVAFGTWTLPRIAPVSEALADAGFRVHGVLGLLLALTVALHVAGAVYRGVVVGDRTIARMLRG
jgi:cytochrome b561